MTRSPSLDSLYTASPYLKRLAARHDTLAQALAEIAAYAKPGEQAQALANQALSDIASDTSAMPLPTLMTRLRDAKGQVALITAVADCLEWWPLEETTATLSALADTALNAALCWCVQDAVRRGELSPNTEYAPQGLFVLAMGKLGARELNYSSDVDIIVFYDPERLRHSGRRSLHGVLTRLVRHLVEILEKRTADGYVFRVDLRLRPDPGSSALALSVPAALGYYQSVGKNWERSAFIKARFAAGDAQAASRFMDEMQSWIWRRSVDFGALVDLAALKDQVHAQTGYADPDFTGFDVKLGRGGIRDIELFTQINQLLFGGRDTTLRVRETCDALNRLVLAGHLPQHNAAALIEAYRFLRRLEHAIQIRGDEQTHAVPDQLVDQQAVAALLATPLKTLESQLTEHRKNVRAQFDGLLPAPAASLPLPGFAQTDDVATILKRWRSGENTALRSPTARAWLEDILIDLLEAFETAENPKDALLRFDRFLSKLPAGAQFFSTLRSNRALLKLLVKVMTATPWLADMLSARPALWGVVVEPDFLSPTRNREQLDVELRAYLASARDYQDVLDLCRQFLVEQKFRLGLLFLEGLATLREVAAGLSDLADSVLTTTFSAAKSDFEGRHGLYPGFDVAVVAFGKLGGRAMTLTSDADIIFFYSETNAQRGDEINPAEEGATQSRSPSWYFSRLAQHMITAATALTPSGRLYDIDTRLKPHGTQGPLIVHLSTLERYYSDDAWTWELLTLTRYRLISYGALDPEPIHAMLQRAIQYPRTAGTLSADTRAMRQRLLTESPPKSTLHVKRAAGGLVDIEFILQYLVLKTARDDAEVITPNYIDLIDKFRRKTVLSPDQAALMTESLILFSTLQAALRLCIGETPKSLIELAPATADVLCKVTGLEDLDQLATHVTSLQAQVRAVFNSVICPDNPLYKEH